MVKRRWLRYGLVGLMVGLALFTMACSGGEATVEGGATAEDTPDGQALLEGRCAQCHGTERPTSASKTEAEWRKTVETMVSKGAQLSTAEIDTLVAYLAEMYGP